jgi:hypothetical protein
MAFIASIISLKHTTLSCDFSQDLAFTCCSLYIFCLLCSVLPKLLNKNYATLRLLIYSVVSISLQMLKSFVFHCQQQRRFYVEKDNYSLKSSLPSTPCMHVGASIKKRTEVVQQKFLPYFIGSHGTPKIFFELIASLLLSKNFSAARLSSFESRLACIYKVDEYAYFCLTCLW